MDWRLVVDPAFHAPTWAKERAMHTDTKYTGAKQESTQGDRHPIDDDYNIHDASFRRHFQLNYGDERLDYESVYAPAYRYGFELSGENPNETWEEMEPEAQRHWAEEHSVSWATVADAVRYGWDEERNPDKHRVSHPRQQ
jgi:hypothetical protein